MRQQLRTTTPEAVRQVALWIIAHSMTEDLPNVNRPVLSLIGRHDTVVPPLHQVRLMQRLPRAQAQIVPGGHLPFVENPTPIARALTGWMHLA